jgi:NAD-dependent dihydropyrimidine dehydrogenase PreA subunit
MPLRGPLLPTIVLDLCTGCGDCAATCPTGALEVRAGKAGLARPEDCVYCGDCESLCPQGAIALSFEIVFAEEKNVSTDCAD